jgi:hypothetical protein
MRKIKNSSCAAELCTPPTQSPSQTAAVPLPVKDVEGQYSRTRRGGRAAQSHPLEGGAAQSYPSGGTGHQSSSSQGRCGEPSQPGGIAGGGEGGVVEEECGGGEEMRVEVGEEDSYKWGPYVNEGIQ